MTGSNAFLLSSDLATLFTGRTFEVKIYSFSFKEFLRYYELEDIDLAFDKYVLDGGLSGSYLYKIDEDKYNYISEVYQNLVVRDIIKKYKIKNKELLRRGYELYVGILHGKEVDFVAIKQSKKIYIQVSDNISDEKTFKREVDSLLKIKDAYPKMIIARTKHEKYQYEGVEIVDIAKWLADEE